MGGGSEQPKGPLLIADRKVLARRELSTHMATIVSRNNINPGSKVHNGSSLPAALGMAGDGWGWLGEGGDGGDGSFVTEITYGKFIN